MTKVLPPPISDNTRRILAPVGLHTLISFFAPATVTSLTFRSAGERSAPPSGRRHCRGSRCASGLNHGRRNNNSAADDVTAACAATAGTGVAGCHGAKTTSVAWPSAETANNSLAQTLRRHYGKKETRDVTVHCRRLERGRIQHQDMFVALSTCFLPNYKMTQMGISFSLNVTPFTIVAAISNAIFSRH